MTSVAGVIHRQICSDAIKPRSEFCAGFVALTRSIDPQKDLLRKILRYRGVAGHPVHETYQGTAILLHQVIECWLVSRFDSQHDLGIAGTLGTSQRRGQ